MCYSIRHVALMFPLAKGANPFGTFRLTMIEKIHLKTFYLRNKAIRFIICTKIHPTL